MKTYRYYNWHSQNHTARPIEDDVSPTIPAALGMGGASMTTPVLIQEINDEDIHHKDAARKTGGGKGALISNDLSLTLGCNNDQTLIIIGNEDIRIGREHNRQETAERRQRGGGYREEVAYTMDTIGNFGIAQVEDDMEQKIFTLDADRSNSMKSANPNSGIHESDVAKTLDTTMPTPQKAQGGQMIVAYDARGNGDGKTANTITGDHANRVTDFTPIVASFMGGQDAKAGGIGYEENVSSTIKAAPSGGNQVPDVMCVHGSQDPISNTEHANAVNRNNGLENCVCVGLQQNQVGEVREYDTSSTLNTNGNASGRNSPLVRVGNENGGGVCQYGDSAGTLTERYDSSPCSDRGQNVLASHLSVRRLMPIECERLMGFPDNWTRIPWRGKPAEECPDAPRYKACGNSMGVNCMRWIGLGIEMVEKNHKKE